MKMGNGIFEVISKKKEKNVFQSHYFSLVDKYSCFYLQMCILKREPTHD